VASSFLSQSFPDAIALLYPSPRSLSPFLILSSETVICTRWKQNFSVPFACRPPTSDSKFLKSSLWTAQWFKRVFNECHLSSCLICGPSFLRVHQLLK
jgi:hypothetical protein